MSDERDDYRGDVWYEEYRRGLPEGSLSDDDIDRGYDEGQSASGLVNAECQRQVDRRAARENEEMEWQDAQWQDAQQHESEE